MGTDVEPRPAAALDLRDSGKLVDLIMGLDEFETLDPDETSRRIVEAIVNAPDLDSAFALSETIPFEELIGQPIEIADFTVNASRFNAGKGAFFVLRGSRLGDGIAFVTTTSARNVLAHVARAARMGELPLKLRADYAEGQNRFGGRTVIVHRHDWQPAKRG